MGYLDRLKALDAEKCLPTQLQKPQQPPFRSFCSTQQSRFPYEERRSDDCIAELRHLLAALLWDDPAAVEPEIKRTLADNAVDEALTMYRRLVADYTRLGELPATKHEIKNR